MGRRSKPLTETGGGGGKTFDIIHRTLTEALGYTVYYKIRCPRRRPAAPQVHFL